MKNKYKNKYLSKNEKEPREQKEEEIIPEEMKEDILESDIGAILNLTADENNPVSDGLEYKEEENKDE